MPDPSKVLAYAKDTGARQYVPAHFLNHPTLGANLSRTPVRRSETPDESWTLAQLRKHAERVRRIDTTGLRSKADFLAAIHNPLTPAAGDDTPKE